MDREPDLSLMDKAKSVYLLKYLGGLCWATIDGVEQFGNLILGHVIALKYNYSVLFLSWSPVTCGVRRTTINTTPMTSRAT